MTAESLIRLLREASPEERSQALAAFRDGVEDAGGEAARANGAQITDYATASAELQRELDRMASALSEDDLIDAAASLAARHSLLRGRSRRLRSLLAWEAHVDNFVNELSGAPRSVVGFDALRRAHAARIHCEAVTAIWEEPMLKAGAVAEALGATATNREKVRLLRERSHLLGLPRASAYLYPAFQFDVAKRRIHTEVATINEILEARDDPWGVASWWVSENGRLGARPLELVGADRAEDLIRAAKSVVESVG